MRHNQQVSRSLKLSICAPILMLAVAWGWNFRSAAKPDTGNHLDSENQPSTPQAFPTVAPDLPPDFTGGAPAATLQQAATFAWQEFFALNWPAKAGVRDTADTTKLFGDQSGPLVWQTYRSKVETFPGNGSASVGPHGTIIPPSTPNSSPTPSNPPNYGYDDPPQYVYGGRAGVGGQVSPCSGQTAPAQPAWINLDEVTQITLDKMFAGILPAASTKVNARPQLIRFMAKANRTQYTYVVQNQYWYNTTTSPVRAAAQNFINATSSQANPQVPQPPYVSFPPDTIEVKAAWRQLASNEDPSRFHMTTVRYYEKSTVNITCYREAPWALIALHIIRKTPTAPSFIYATFEQADNILLPALDKDGKPVALEDEDGNFRMPPPPASPIPTPAIPTTPGLSYTDDPKNPQVSPTPSGSSYCLSPGAQIFYINTTNQSGVPTGKNICVNKRDNSIPSDVIAVNKAAHDAIRAYNKNNGISQSPWLYYKLVNVQAFPFDKSQIDPTNPNGIHNPATFFQANIVVETNYTLQLFHGRISANGAPTDFPVPAPSPTPKIPLTPVIPPNVYTFIGTPKPTVRSYNMGGCMGCHGNAQALGYDFSFILKQGGVLDPESPAISSATLVKRYRFALDKR